jgi:hypothetical protein
VSGQRYQDAIPLSLRLTSLLPTKGDRSKPAKCQEIGGNVFVCGNVGGPNRALMH